LDLSAPEEVLLPAVRDFRLRFTDYDFQVDLSPCSNGLKVDQRKIVQVMENLLSNAVKYSPDSRIIVVKGRCEGNEYQVSVRDWGIGMTPEQAAQAFDKFYRADHSNIAVSGTGLGLSIVKHIVASHGGRIWIDSAPGTGSSVYFTLPR
jgi:signal transduction histidine kinase